MATTSPDNLRSPNPGDAYNLTSDWANSMNDVQAALTLRANAYKGTASDRAAFTATATDGMLWTDTDSINMIWRKAGAAWVPAVWDWSGTTTQMNAFAAPDGFKWYNTTNNSDYVRLSGAWVGSTGTISPGSGMTVIGNSFVKRDAAKNVFGLMRVTGTITNAKTIATLPSGFRPVSSMAIGGVSTGTSGTAWSPFDIFTSGDIVIYSPFATNPTGATLQFTFKAA